MPKMSLCNGNFLRIPLVLGIVILLAACGPEKTAAYPTNSDIEPTSIGTPEISLPTMTGSPVPETPFLTLTSMPTATPITLDPAHWTHFTSPVEVLESDVHHIDQAQDGTLWFSGFKIYRYDGENWSIFDQEKIPAFRGQVITSLAVAADGTVWFGTEMNEVVSFDGKAWTSQTVEEGGYRENWISSIVIRRTGEVCAISIEGMSCRNSGKWVHHPIVLPETVNRIYANNAILTTHDEIWVPLSNGEIYRYDGKNWEGSKVSDWVCCLAASRDGLVWIFDNEGFGKLNTEGKFEYRWAPALIRENTNAIAEAPDGSVWFGRGTGHVVAHYINESYVTVDGIKLDDSESQYSLISAMRYPFTHVNTIFAARDGSIWFGTIEGIFRYK